ncbi:hypothetical protein PSY62_23990, partial [Shigella flexneri]|nr:hypothetical protein [Shigella flexneri]
VRFAQGCSSMALSCEYTNNPDITLAIDKSGLLVYSQESAIDEHPCSFRTGMFVNGALL